MTRRPLKRATRRLSEPQPLQDPLALKLRRRLKRGEPPTREELLRFGASPAVLIDALRAVLMNEWVLPTDPRTLERVGAAMAALDPAAAAPILVALRTTPGGDADTDGVIDDALVACGPPALTAIAEHLARFGDRPSELEALAIATALLYAAHRDPRALPIIAAARDRDWWLGAVCGLLSGDLELHQLTVTPVLQRPLTDDTSTEDLLRHVQLASLARNLIPPAPSAPALGLRAQIAEVLLGAREGGDEEPNGRALAD